VGDLEPVDRLKRQIAGERGRVHRVAWSLCFARARPLHVGALVQALAAEHAPGVPPVSFAEGDEWRGVSILDGAGRGVVAAVTRLLVREAESPADHGVLESECEWQVQIATIGLPASTLFAEIAGREPGGGPSLALPALFRVELSSSEPWPGQRDLWRGLSRRLELLGADDVTARDGRAELEAALRVLGVPDVDAAP
jgi:hypothetical protein